MFERPAPALPPAHLHPTLPFLRLRPVEEGRLGNRLAAGTESHSCQRQEEKEEQIAAVRLVSLPKQRRPVAEEVPGHERAEFGHGLQRADVLNKRSGVEGDALREAVG